MRSSKTPTVALLIALLLLLLLPVAEASAQKIPFQADLELIPGGPHPYQTVEDFSGTVDAVWDATTRTFDHFTLVVEGGYPVSSTFPRPFVYILPSWAANDETTFRHPLPMTLRASLAAPCCGFYFDTTNGQASFRLDGNDLPPPSGEPAWITDLIKDALSQGDFRFVVYNDFDCIGCIVTGNGAPNSGEPILERQFASAPVAVPALSAIGTVALVLSTWATGAWADRKWFRASSDVRAA